MSLRLERGTLSFVIMEGVAVTKEASLPWETCQWRQGKASVNLPQVALFWTMEHALDLARIPAAW